MSYCKVRKAEIYYEDLGEGIPIIMIHGFSPDHRLMKGCMEPLFKERKGWRRIYIDLPGMGRTKNYQDISTSDDMLESVIEFIDHIIPNQDYVIAGESYGGYLARGIIHKQLQHIKGAAFICPVIYPYAKDRSLVPHIVMKRDESFLESLSPEELEDFSHNNVVLNEHTWVRYNQEVVSGARISDSRLLSKVQQNYGFSFSIDQYEFHKPSVFLLGRQDSVVGYQDALNLLNKYSRGTFGILDEAGHNLQIEKDILFNSLINDWLDRVNEN
ncbi:alpha/beta fold hydrolase [Ornithinibacillus scapharcae]|uniref:alpha/beta fold hydrolase n=1 Tax=Ornithinibacillus scapharcae TaxID=1147159 RepID=UPI000225B5ED|nr:alpha/beta hydrolase [Ornithinibacillus scapharcae]